MRIAGVRNVLAWALVAILGAAQAAAAAEARAPVLDPAPRDDQKPYAPADGQEVEVTPPAFIWVPAGSKPSESKVVYRLQVSRSRDFPEAGTRTFGPLERSVFVPSETLDPGEWFWRYGIETAPSAEGPAGAAPAAAVAWGRARPFRIAPSARPFPFPDLEALCRSVPAARPRLFFPGERLEAIRRAARAELRGPIDGLVRAASRHVGEDLVAEPGYPPSGADRGPWAVNVMRTTRPPMDAMERCALAYLVTGDERLGAEAKRRLLHFFSWDPEKATSFFVYDEPPMWVMMRGTRAYDWTHDLFTAEERTRIEANMKARALQFLKRLRALPFECRPYDSHAGRLPGFLGECALSFIHEWPEAREWLEHAILLYMTSYPAWGGDDGGWQEGPGYWSAYMGFALHFVVALRHATRFDLMQKPFFRNTPFYGLYTAAPYLEHAPFGDGANGRPGPRLAAVLHAFSSLLGDPSLRWFAEAAGYRVGSDVLGLATHDPSLAAIAPLSLPQARAFPSVGLASIHTALGDASRDVSFLLRSSPYGSISHGHADQNAFVLEAFGKGLAIATGYYPWYGSPHHHDWTRATRSVNSVLVDGEGQVRRSRQACGEIVAFRSVEGYDHVEAEAAAAYGGRLEGFRRHAVHIRPGIFVILDNLVATKPATFQWLLHAYRKMELEPDRGRIRIENAPAALDVRLLQPPGLAFSETDRYEPEPEDTKGSWDSTWHLTASTTRPERSVRFLAVLLPHRIGEEASLPDVELVEGDGAMGAKVGADLVLFRTAPAGEPARCAGEDVRGRVLAVGRGPDGRTARRLEAD